MGPVVWCDRFGNQVEIRVMPAAAVVLIVVSNTARLPYFWALQEVRMSLLRHRRLSIMMGRAVRIGA